MQDSFKVVFSVNNTHGILPEKVRDDINKAMADTTSDSGMIIIGLWNGNSFGDAVQHFYAQNDHLCGSLQGASFDWDECKMVTASNYTTKWTKPEELGKMIDESWNVLDVVSSGPMLLIAAKPKNTKVQDNASGEAGAETEYYYDTEDASRFYQNFWGGENVHIGLYDNLEEPNESKDLETVFKASDKSLTRLLDHVYDHMGGLKIRRAMDMGSCYGGCAREMAQRFACEVLCVDMSKVENDINRERTLEAGLEKLVKIPGELSFTDTRAAANHYCAVVSQDSYLHGSDKEAIFAEVSRVLRPEGVMVFTDIMQSDTADPDELQPVYDRIGLTSMGSVTKYVEYAGKHGLVFKLYEDHTEQMIAHYDLIHHLLAKALKNGDIERMGISHGFTNNMLRGLRHWVEQGKKGNLQWGYSVFQKKLQG